MVGNIYIYIYIIFFTILVVCVGLGIFYPVAADFFFSPNQFFGRGLNLPKLRNLRKNVVHTSLS